VFIDVITLNELSFRKDSQYIFVLLFSSILLSVPVWAIAATHVTQVRA
jgi:hypothetical protein